MKCKISNIKYDHNNSKHHILMGGDPTNPSWDEYLKDFKMEFQPKIESLKQFIIDEKMVGRVGSWMNEIEGFEFDDGTLLCFTWRAWGDFMQALVNKNEGYMAYYM